MFKDAGARRVLKDLAYKLGYNLNYNVRRGRYFDPQTMVPSNNEHALERKFDLLEKKVDLLAKELGFEFFHTSELNRHPELILKKKQK